MWLFWSRNREQSLLLLQPKLAGRQPPLTTTRATCGKTTATVYMGGAILEDSCQYDDDFSIGWNFLL